MNRKEYKEVMINAYFIDICKKNDINFNFANNAGNMWIPFGDN